MGHLRVTVVHLRVTIRSILVITFLSISKHKANTTELHPKVRQTCLHCILSILCSDVVVITNNTKPCQGTLQQQPHHSTS